jgi:hypothetical protein
MFDFQIPQTFPETFIPTGSKYGFNNQYSAHFQHLQNPDILTIDEPESKSALERWESMRHQEDLKFDREWYLADKLEPPDDLDEILKYQLPSNLADPFTPEEQTKFQNLGNRECIPPVTPDLSSHRQSKRYLLEFTSPPLCDSLR